MLILVSTRPVLDGDGLLRTGNEIRSQVLPFLSDSQTLQKHFYTSISFLFAQVVRALFTEKSNESSLL